MKTFLERYAAITACKPEGLFLLGTDPLAVRVQGHIKALPAMFLNKEGANLMANGYWTDVFPLSILEQLEQTQINKGIKQRYANASGIPTENFNIVYDQVTRTYGANFSPSVMTNLFHASKPIGQLKQTHYGGYDEFDLDQLIQRENARIEPVLE